MKRLKRINILKFFKITNFFFFISIIFFIAFPNIDIPVSEIFFLNGKFISEEYHFIKSLRQFLKNLMVIFPILVMVFLLLNFLDKENKYIPSFSKRTKFALLGFLIGPIVGCGIIANLYFKDTWGRARPVHIEEFGGNKIFTKPFVKTDQCKRNCSWISGETSGAFSFMVGSIILRNHLFILINLIIGLLVFFCRLSMGGHFLSDNIFAMFFMIYLAYIYRYYVFLKLKRK